MIPDNARDGLPQAKPGCVTSQDVENAYQAFAALQRLARDDANLAGNVYFKAVKDTAFARFILVYEAL